MMKRLTITLFLCCILPACSPNHYPAHGAYVASDPEGYVVRIGFQTTSDETISKPMDLDDAKRIADQINQAMGNHWSGK